MTLPNTLLYICDRLAGFSTNVFKMNPNGSTNASANDIVTFDLPSNSIVNLKSFKVFFNATLTGTTARLPADVHSLIERVEVSAGGIMLSQGSNFHNVLHKAKQAVCECKSNPLAHTEIVRTKSYFDGTTMTGTANESSARKLCWNEWDNTFLGTAEPGFIDTALMPDLKVRIYLAPNSVLSSSKGISLGADFVAVPDAGASASYALSNLSANVECVSMGDTMYDEMVNSLMQKQGFLEIPFKSVHTFNNLHSGATRFSVSSQSLDRIWLVWRSSSYGTLGHPVTVSGFKKTGAFVASASNGATTSELGLPEYDTGVFGTNSEKYIGKYFDFETPSADMNTQVQLNGAYIPQYKAGPEEWLELTRNSIPTDIKKDLTLDQYLSNYFVQCIRLNFPGSEDMRLLSGLDCRSVNLDGLVSTDNAGSGHYVTIFTESTSTLRIGLGRELQVVS